RAIRQDYPAKEAEFDVALNTGVRRNELYRMTWDQVDLERRIVTIHGKAHARSKASRRRFIPLNPAAAAAFAELNARAGDSPYVCQGPHNGTETDRDWRDWFDNSVKRAGVVNFRYHDLRQHADSPIMPTARGRQRPQGACVVSRVGIIRGLPGKPPAC